MAITSSLEPKPALNVLPDADRKQIQTVLRQPIPEIRALRRRMMSHKVSHPCCAGCDYLYQDIVP